MFRLATVALQTSIALAKVITELNLKKLRNSGRDPSSYRIATPRAFSVKA